MRKKFLILLFTAVATFASAFCLSACASELGTVDGGQSGIIYPSTGTEGNTVGNDSDGADQSGPSSDSGDDSNSDSSEGDGQSADGENSSVDEETSEETADETQDSEESEHKHNLAYVAGTKPGCTVAGNIEYWYCDSCGRYFADSGAVEEISGESLALAETGHNYEQKIVQPTCTESGYTEYVCSNCGDSYIDENSYVQPAGHTFGEWQTVVSATCESGGEDIRYCTECDFFECRQTNELGHDYVAFTVEPTCTEQGYVSYTCSRCNDSYADTSSYTPVKGHSYGEWVITTEPTCYAEGERVRTCGVCHVMEIQKTDKLPHSYAETIVMPTCTEQGYTEHECAVCGDSYTDGFTPASGHAYAETTILPTCTEQGYTEYECTVCGDSYTDGITPALGHDCIYTTVEPTCTAGGYDWYCCANCGYSGIVEGSETEKTPHNLKEHILVAAKCDADGEKLIYCADCSYSITEILPALGHDYAQKIVPPTCTGQGYTEHLCGVCGESYKDSYTPALGHDYMVTVVEPTCTGKGFTLYQCTVCGYMYTDDITEAAGHSYRTEVTEPTCTSEGYTAYICTVCGYECRGQYTAKTDHTYVANTVKPTCTERGYTEYMCSACGDSYIDENSYTDTIPHSYEKHIVKEATCTQKGEAEYVCSVCGISCCETIPAHGHSYGSWVEVVAATCTQSGVRVHSCIYCGVQEGELISALGHEYAATIIEPDCVNGGYTQHECVHCGNAYADSVTEPLGHDYGEWLTLRPATCADEGEEIRICAVCGAEERRVIEVTEHEYAAVTVEPTCTERGYTEYICAECGAGYISGYVSALGHDMAEVGSGYLANGAEYTDYKCLRCGYEERVEGEAPVATQGIIFTLSADGGYYIADGLEADCAETDIVIPAIYGGLPVLEIGERAFSDNQVITSVTLPYGLETISEGAFSGCTSLRRVNIPETVVNICAEAFRNCFMLENVYYDAVNAKSQATDIFTNAGKDNGGLVLTIGSAAEVIPACLFYSIREDNAPKLTQIDFAEADSLKSIGDSAFYGCKYLTEVNIPETVEKLGDCAFACCGSLVYASVPSKAVGSESAFILVDSEFELVVRQSGSAAFQQSVLADFQSA